MESSKVWKFKSLTIKKLNKDGVKEWLKLSKKFVRNDKKVGFKTQLLNNFDIVCWWGIKERIWMDSWWEF